MRCDATRRPGAPEKCVSCLSRDSAPAEPRVVPLPPVAGQADAGTVLEVQNVSKSFLKRARTVRRRRRRDPGADQGEPVGPARGETLGIVGESGSGKTTLSKIIMLRDRCPR